MYSNDLFSPTRSLKTRKVNFSDMFESVDLTDMNIFALSDPWVETFHDICCKSKFLTTFLLATINELTLLSFFLLQLIKYWEAFLPEAKAIA